MSRRARCSQEKQSLPCTAWCHSAGDHHDVQTGVIRCMQVYVADTSAALSLLRRSCKQRARARTCLNAQARLTKYYW